MSVAGRQPGVPIWQLEIDEARVDAGRWPYTLPVVAQVVEHGLRLDPGINVFIGANGTGKSTLVEAIAACWARRVTAFRDDWMQRAVGAPAEEDSDLRLALRPTYTRGGPTGACSFVLSDCTPKRLGSVLAGVGRSASVNDPY